MQEDNKSNEQPDVGFEIQLGDAVTQSALHSKKTILLKNQVEKQIDEFAVSDTTRELGGVLLGNPEEYNEELCLSVTAMLKAKKTAANKTSLTFTHETWEQIHHEKEILYPELKIVGWFHTHPGFGVFLSNDDLFIQQNFFNLPWQVAYVIDPVNNEKGFFAWEGGEIVPSHYRVMDNGQEVLGSLPLKEAPVIVAPEEGSLELVKSTTRYRVMLIVMVLLLILTNLQRFSAPEPDLELQEALHAKDRQIETLLTEMNRQEEQMSVLGDEKQRLEERVNQLSGEYFHVYTVMPGDTLWSISDRYYNDPAEHQFLMRLNDLNDPDSLEVGQTLLLYKKGD